MNSVLPLVPFAVGLIAVVAAFVLAYRLQALEGSLNQADRAEGRGVEGVVWQMPDPVEEAEARRYRMLGLGFYYA